MSYIHTTLTVRITFTSRDPFAEGETLTEIRDRIQEQASVEVLHVERETREEGT